MTQTSEKQKPTLTMMEETASAFEGNTVSVNGKRAYWTGENWWTAEYPLISITFRPAPPPPSE